MARMYVLKVVTWVCDRWVPYEQFGIVFVKRACFTRMITTMSKRQVPTAVAQRIVVRFLVSEGVKNTEIFLRLRNQFGSECLSRAAVFKWVKAFKNGRETVENEPHDRRPRTSIIPGNIRWVEQLILEDRGMSVRDISAELGISIVPSMLHTTPTFWKHM